MCVWLTLSPAQHAWTHKNQLFVGVYQAMRGCEYPWYITSSKAAHRISALMGSLLGIDLPTDSPRLFANLIAPEESKIEALRWAPALISPFRWMLGVQCTFSEYF